MRVANQGLLSPTLKRQALSSASSLDMGAPPRPAPPGILLHALEQTLRQAAEQAVAAAATASLSPAVNHAAAAIEHFAHERVQHLEERLMHYQHELMASAREDLRSQVQAEVTRGEEHLRQRTSELIEEAARHANDLFAERFRETANQALFRFNEDAAHSSANYFARIVEQVHTVTSDAQAQIENKAAMLSESQENAKGEMERAIAETQKRVESLASLIKKESADWEARLTIFQEKLALSSEEAIERIRERLRNVLTTLLSALR